MIIRQEFQELPPKMFLSQVMDGLSKVYCFLWDRKDTNNNFSINWDELGTYFHRNNFRTNVRKLNDRGLLSYQESGTGIQIELVGWDDIDDD